jgi:hypothetical protein
LNLQHYLLVIIGEVAGLERSSHKEEEEDDEATSTTNHCSTDLST